MYGGSFRLHLDLHATEDNIAPSRITDLKVLKILRYRNSIALTWTAPGDDLDTGKGKVVGTFSFKAQKL